MPITKGAKKALRQAERRTVRNAKKKEEYKRVLKDARKLLDAKNIKEVEALFPKVQKALDKAAKTHVIEKNTANRLKSRLSKKIAALKKG